MRLARPLEKLIDELLKLPGIGPKSAQRLALFILKMEPSEVRRLAAAMIEAREKVFPCSRCGNLTDQDPCWVCADEKRDESVICVVEEAGDVMSIERTGYRGLYYVLNQEPHLMEEGALEKLKLAGLLDMVDKGRVKEIILATNPTVDGELVARYIAGMVKAKGVKITRPAHGLPVGGDIEYSDALTLRKALEGRQEI
ncbi:MAG TPA: recombination protein RecR [Syntrophothermus lipocalidus]|uniref:Recombination protein RecR n=1 Tax=Syntrophothermus lipocalidus (strain DSM 12680 / TGB-C1) TaxID=643648 RepID=D7CIH8_SYNLT|nr:MULTISPECIES: recombination mediator RecR [Syntrophothermus]ADI00843.1 recombination protein RecR [Syntrophothermus lipocalidus DSM 12680]NSW83497.1 recombination protein RecR [Syntrophothermus sp.]HHV76558.1 recombination protein RecR [Syntrophothermus lipocalidus]HOV42696.1 recombination mediator RecR [Syntrophothermus lipocalidus]